MVETTVPLNMLYLDFALFIFHHIHSHTGCFENQLSSLYVQIKLTTIECRIRYLHPSLNTFLVAIYFYQLLDLVETYFHHTNSPYGKILIMLLLLTFDVTCRYFVAQYNPDLFSFIFIQQTCIFQSHSKNVITIST